MPAIENTRPQTDAEWAEEIGLKRTIFGNYRPKEVLDELHDYRFVLSQVPKVYSHVSGGRISKPNTYAHEVIGEHDQRRNDDIEEALKDEIAYAIDAIDPEEMAAFLNQTLGVSKKTVKRKAAQIAEWLKGRVSR